MGKQALIPPTVENPCFAEMPVNYVIYTHYAYEDGNDFKAWRDKKMPVDPSEVDRLVDRGILVGPQYLKGHLRGLGELLTCAGFEGRLVIFYGPGLVDCLDQMEAGRQSRETILSGSERLRFADTVAKWFERELEGRPELWGRVVFFTALDLFTVFETLNETLAGKLRWWFVGRGPGAYDTPKIIEAIARVRLLGNGVPVFRLDWDVLFRTNNVAVANLGLAAPISSCLKAYQLRLAEPSVGSFMFSASYDTVPVARGGTDAEKFENWCGLFATRVFPALNITESIKKPLRRRSAYNELYWVRYADENFDAELARKFYGLSSVGLAGMSLQGLPVIGANPLVSVISGALLCLSDGAILDLPPFSNLSRSVSWVDDHLKYCLHRELGHFVVEPMPGDRDASLRDAKIDSVTLQKERARIVNLPAYVLEGYLPTLLLGCVMDAWITPSPIVKYRMRVLSEQQRAVWQQARLAGPEGALPGAMRRARRAGSFTERNQNELKASLASIAATRIEEVRGQWRKLTKDGVDTFASAWATGDSARMFSTDGLAAGIADRSVRRITSLECLNPALRTELENLIDDVTEYIQFTLNWPNIVQVVRSLDQGTLAVDVSWSASRNGRGRGPKGPRRRGQTRSSVAGRTPKPSATTLLMPAPR